MEAPPWVIGISIALAIILFYLIPIWLISRIASAIEQLAEKEEGEKVFHIGSDRLVVKAIDTLTEETSAVAHGLHNLNRQLTEKEWRKR